MTRLVRGVLCLFFFLLIFTKTVHAESSYVLPYPSAMPGSKFYILHLTWEKISKYWYFGDFAQINYNLQLSDKYLVEAKTLFEYEQYLLGVAALQKSDDYFQKVLPPLLSADNSGKNISEQKAKMSSAGKKHVDVLSSIKKVVPEQFAWIPEKERASLLPLHDLIDDAVKIRMQVYE